MKISIAVLYYWITAILWYGLILFISSLPNLDKAATSSDALFQAFTYGLMYSMLFLLTFRALLGTVRAKVERLRYWKSRREEAEDTEFAFLVEALLFLVAFMLVIIMAIADEYLQSQVIGRNGTAVEVVINAIFAGITGFAILKFPILAEIEALFITRAIGNKRHSKN